MRKIVFCLCENKGADQLCNSCTADNRLCFRYNDVSKQIQMIYVGPGRKPLGPAFLVLQP